MIQPVFVTYDEKEREAYLSQLGNFSPNERSIFHKLCRVWEPLIPYARFIAMINRDTPNSNAELMRLMAKLSKGHMGIIVSKIKEGSREPDSILICEPGQQIFFSYLLEEEILDVFENLHQPLPTQKGMTEKGTPIPVEYLREMKYRDIAELYVHKKTRGTDMYMVENQGSDMFLLTQNSLVRILTIAISKMRSLFQSSNFLALGASILEMSLTELRGNIDAKEPGFWKDMTGTFLEQKENLMVQRKVKIPEDLFDICRYLHRFLEAQIIVAKEKKARDEEKQADMSALAEIIQKAENYLVPRDLFENHIDSFKEKYGEYFPNFRSDFEKAYFRAESGRNLPVILQLDENLIHEDNIKPLFIQRVEKLSRELYKHYLPLMSRYIRSKQGLAANIFNSSATFESDIEDQVKQMDKLSASLLAKPATVAEAFIQSARKTRQLNSVDEMKGVLVSFFYPDQIQFKELQVIFNLNVKDMYHHAFLNFSILRQIIMRITGRHESFRNKFADQVSRIYQRMETEAALPSKYPHGKTGGLSRANERGSSPSRGQRRGTSRAERRLSNGRDFKPEKKHKQSMAEEAKAVAKRRYSEQERNDAWTEFSKSLKK